MGRTKEFKREEVLHKAMLVFWEKGFNDTSIPNLLTAMDISRSSLYETFVDKQTLYLEALQYYKQSREEKTKILKQADSAEEGIRAFFKCHIDLAFSGDTPKSCMITNATVAIESLDNLAQSMIRESYADIEDSFYQLLASGVATGEISAAKDIKFLSFLLLNLVHSTNLLSKIKQDKQEFYDMVDEVIKMIK